MLPLVRLIYNLQMKTSRAFLIATCPLLFALASSCSAFDKRNSEKEKQEAAAKAAAAPSTQIPDEVSLKEDRAQLDELRKDIPEDVRRDNDEVAFILKNMATMEEEASKVRDRFNTAVRKRRDKMDKQLRKEREDFSKTERSTREDFLKKLQSEREDFNSSKRDSKERKKFFDKQDGVRKEFFADQSEKRKDFEGNVTERRKAFEDYVREQSNKFNQEHRAYSQAYVERRQALELKKRAEEKGKRLEKQKAIDASEASSETAPVKPQQGGLSAEDRALIEEMSKPRTEKIKALKAPGDDN